MRTAILLFALSLAYANSTAYGTEDRPVFSARSEMAQMSIAIIGADDRTFLLEDFTIIDNNHTQPLVYLSPKPLPLDVFVLMDTSNSMTVRAQYQKPRLLPDMVQAVHQLIKTLRPGDRMQIREFSEHSNTLAYLTEDRRALTGAISHATIGGGETRLMRELRIQLIELAKMPMDPEQPHHRVIVVITDNTDTTEQTDADQRDLIAKVRATKVAVYVLGLEPSAYTMSTFEGEKLYRSGRYLMQQACKESGGTFVEARTPEIMLRLAKKLSQELAMEYVLWWEVPADANTSPWHTVQLQVRGIPSDHLRHPPGYLRSLK